MEKDFRYIIETAQTLGTSTPVSAAIHDVYQAAIAQGYGNDNITGVIKLWELKE